MLSSSNYKWRETEFAFWALVAFLIVIFFTGGSARPDVQSLAILRPVSILLFGTALWKLNLEHVRANLVLLAMAAAIMALVVAYLVPLPADMWVSLPGRDLAVAVGETSNIGGEWRPASVAPSMTWNSLYSLFAPLTIVLLGIQLRRNERHLLLPIALSLGILAGLWGLMQAVGDPKGPLYLYQITNNGGAVGLFANRNHQALLMGCMFPMLAIYASSGPHDEEGQKWRSGLALAVGVVLVPLILVTGSRAGLISGLLGVLSVPLLYIKAPPRFAAKRKVRRMYLRYLAVGFSILMLGAITALMARAEAIERLSSPDQAEDLRFRMWPQIVEIALRYFPVGSGPGSFVPVYQRDEPDQLLMDAYVNQAHNDWLDLFLTTGLPGLLLAGVALILLLKRGITVFRYRALPGSDGSLHRLGFVLIVLILIASVGDYPLRTPYLSALAAIALLWFTGKRRDTDEKAGTV